MLLARFLARSRPLRVLDLMAGCGLRSVRYGLEAKALSLLVNDADPSRLSLLHENLAVLEGACLLKPTAQGALRLLADALLKGERYDLVDLDAFGSPQALIPLALETVALDGVLYLASSDGRGSTGHDRPAGLRHFGASVRCHPASWELALRLQLGVIARTAWTQGRGVMPVFSFSDGRTFRTAVFLRRHPTTNEERALGLLAVCHRCGDQQVQSMASLNAWKDCLCTSQTFAISGPLWVGPLQDVPTLDAMPLEAQATPISLSREGARLLGRLRRDRGFPARCWPNALIGRELKSPQPPLQALVLGLQQQGYQAWASGVMPGQLRSDAPWRTILSLARELGGEAAK